MVKHLSEIAVDRISPSMEKKAGMISRIMARKIKKFGSKAFVTERGMRPFKGRVLQLGRSGPTVYLTREGHHDSGGSYYPKSHVVAVNPSLFKKKGSVPFNTLTHELFHAYDPGLKKNEFKYAHSDWRKDPQEVGAVLASNSLTGLKIGKEIGVSDKKMRGFLRSGELMRDDPGLNKIAQIGRRSRQKVGKNLYRAYERVYHPETYVHRETPKMKLPESVDFSTVKSAVYASNAGRHTPNHVAVLRRARDTIRANKSHPWAKSPALMGAIKKHLGEDKKENVMHTKELLAYVVNHLVEEEAKKVRKHRSIKPSELQAMIRHSRHPRTKHGFSAVVNHPEPGLVTFDKFFAGKNEVGHRLDTRSFSDQGRLCNFLTKHGVPVTQKTVGGPDSSPEATPAVATKKTKKLKEMVDEDREF